MSLLTVDFDVLSAIVGFLSPSDARSLSQTTRALHAVAQQRALSVLTLRKPQKLIDAHEYLLANVPARAHHIRELKVFFEELLLPGTVNDSLAPVHPGLARTSQQLVADLLENAPLLRSVSIDCTEESIVAEPRLWNALTTLEHLTNVELNGAGPEVLRRLGDLQSPVRRLAFRGQVTERLPLNQMPDATLPLADFVKAWRAYPRLQSVVLSDVSSLDDHRGEHQYAPCPSVTHLDVLRSFVALSDMNAVFPNLRTLSFCHSGRPRLARDSTTLAPERCWTHLDYIRFRTIYAPRLQPWPLASRVRRLDLANVIETDRDRYWSFSDVYIDIVEKTQPVVLRLSTCPSTGEIFWTQILMASRRARCLEVRVRADWRCHKDLRGWLVRQRAIGHAVQLTSLLLPRTRFPLSGPSRAWSMYVSASMKQTSSLRCKVTQSGHWHTLGKRYREDCSPVSHRFTW